MDVTDPELVSVSAEKNEITSGSKLKVDFNIIEEGRGLDRLYAKFTKLGTKSNIRADKDGVNFPNSVDQQLEFDFDGAEEGVYYLRYILIEDKKANRVQYYCDPSTKKYKRNKHRLSFYNSIKE